MQFLEVIYMQDRFLLQRNRVIDVDLHLNINLTNFATFVWGKSQFCHSSVTAVRWSTDRCQACLR